MAAPQPKTAQALGILIGIDVHATGAALVAIDASGQVVDVRQLWQPAEVASLAQACRVLKARWSEPVLGVAVACADPAQWLDLPLLFAPAGPQLQTLGRGTARALAEEQRGALRGCPDCLSVTIGLTLCAGALRGGRPLLPGGSDPELAHLPVVDGGPRCSCGQRGCLQTVATEFAWQRRAEDAGLVAPLDAANGQDPAALSKLGARAARGDAATMAVLAEPLEQLARGIAILASAVGVHDLALQWPGSGANDHLHQQLAARIRHWWPGGRAIAAGQTGPLGSAWGAALWAQQALGDRHKS